MRAKHTWMHFLPLVVVAGCHVVVGNELGSTDGGTALLGSADGGTALLSSADGGTQAFDTCLEIKRVVHAKFASCAGFAPSVVSDEWNAYMCERLANEVAQGLVLFDNTSLASWEARIGAASCAMLSTNDAITTGWVPVFTGTVSGGGACDDDAMCASGSCRFPPDPTDPSKSPLCPGTCEARVPLGGACQVGTAATSCQQSVQCVANICSVANGTLTTGAMCGYDSDCVTEEHCDFQSGNPPTCQPFLPLGASCQQYPQCQSLSCRNGVCVAHLPDGAPCGQVQNNDCASGVCGGSACATLQVVGVGQLCGVSSDGNSKTWCSPGFCSITSGTMGTCVPSIAVGMPCPTLSLMSASMSGTPSAPCQPGSVCTNGKCVVVDACGFPTLPR